MFELEYPGFYYTTEDQFIVSSNKGKVEYI